MVRRVLVCAVIVVGAPASAQAVPVVTAAAPAGRSYDQFSLAVDTATAGVAVVGWTVQSPRDTVQVAYRPRRGRPFTRPVSVGRGRVARVAVSGRGDAAAVAWLDGGRPRITVRDRQGRWRAQNLPSGVPTGETVRVEDLDVRAGGVVTLVLETREAGRWRVQVLERAATGAWRVFAPLAAGVAAGGQAAVDGTGRVTAVWLAVDSGQAPVVRVAQRERGGDWGSSTVLVRGGDGGTPAEPQMVAGARGDVAVLVSVQSDTGGAGVSRVAWQAPGRPWRISRQTPAVGMAVSPRGGIWVTWRAAARGMTVARLRADGTWAGPETAAAVPRGQDVVGGPGVVVRGDGRPLVWWVVDGASSSPDRWLVADRGARAWRAPARLATTDGAVETASGQSGAVAVFVTPAGGGRVMIADVA